jgi:hypothetical protein
MKKLLLFVSLVLSMSALSAQQIPNGSFRYWSGSYAPDGWGTWATATSFTGSVADTLSKLAVVDSFSGDYITDSATLMLTVDTVNLPSQGKVTLAGFASLGGAYYVGPPTGAGLQFGFLAYAQRPDTLYADYRFLPTLGHSDTALIVVSLTKFDTLSHSRLSILSRSFPLTSAVQWQRNASFPLSPYYADTLHPDSIQLIIYSSVSAAPSKGTTLWIDSLHFDASVNILPTGIADISSVNGVTVYPNPSSSELHVAIGEKEQGSLIKLYNASGQIVYDGKLNQLRSIIDISPLASGVYTIRIASADRITVYRGSISIVH